MAKNKGIKNNLNSIGKGILDTLKDSVDVKEENNINVNDENIQSDNNVKDDNSKTVNNNKSKRVKDDSKEKNKRSFMLSDNAIQQLKVLNMVTQKDLSEIVNLALDDYFKKNKKKVEQFLEEIRSTL